jgi:hypothetical protein
MQQQQQQLLQWLAAHQEAHPPVAAGPLCFAMTSLLGLAMMSAAGPVEAPARAGQQQQGEGCPAAPAAGVHPPEFNKQHNSTVM